MSQPFLGEIKLFPYNFAPRGFAFCQGQVLSIAQNTALFSLLGTTYGGNGQTNFALPDLRGRAPMQPGQGPGLSNHDLGEKAGQESVSLLTTQIPSHTHTLGASTQAATSDVPAPEAVPGRSTGGLLAYAAATPGTALSSSALSTAGGSQPHNNMMPYLVLNYCIATQGIFPSRN